VKRRSIFIDPVAQSDLLTIFDFIAEAAGEERASAYIERIMAFCMSFDLISERGQKRDDLRPGLRVTGFERRIAIAFEVTPSEVRFLRFFYGGANWEDEGW